MSLESAKQLALVYYGWLNSTPESRPWVEGLISTSPPEAGYEDLLYLSTEEAWALEQLGYSIPAEFELYEPNIPFYLETEETP